MIFVPVNFFIEFILVVIIVRVAIVVVDVAYSLNYSIFESDAGGQAPIYYFNILSQQRPTTIIDLTTRFAIFSEHL